MVSLRVQGLDELQRALTRLQSQAPQIMLTAMDAALGYVSGALPDYPAGRAGELPAVYNRKPQSRPKRYSRTYAGRPGQRYRSRFRSLRQQRWFYWALRQGLITLHTGNYLSKFKTAKQQAYVIQRLRGGQMQIPYSRTGKLQQSITTESRIQGESVIGIIGTARPYAPRVIGDDQQQAPIHRGRWWQLAAEVSALSDDAAYVLERTAWNEIRRLWQG